MACCIILCATAAERTFKSATPFAASATVPMMFGSLIDDKLWRCKRGTMAAGTLPDPHDAAAATALSKRVARVVKAATSIEVASLFLILLSGLKLQAVAVATFKRATETFIPQ